jgi:hypothetical protein
MVGFSGGYQYSEAHMTRLRVLEVAQEPNARFGRAIPKPSPQAAQALFARFAVSLKLCSKTRSAVSTTKDLSLKWTSEQQFIRQMTSTSIPK